jgi:hypothetical protein
MSDLFAYFVNVVAGLGCLVCYILVLIHLFQSEETGLAIVCIVLTFVCGIGALIAFIKGWMTSARLCGCGQVVLPLDCSQTSCCWREADWNQKSASTVATGEALPAPRLCFSAS